MSDFHQPGVITTLPRLRERPIEELEAEVRALTRKFPVALVLPMVPSEMDRPALAGILDELCQVDYLDTLLVSLNKATREDYQRALSY
ncbi:MAG: glycosyl transferase, partial [Thermoanaerobaculia bacterium]|nr:glycosyl transferase [Thermoanaerobaculia bacterium]